MAIDTNINLQKQVIYSIYVRNHTEEGTFKSIIKDLDRIQSLGCDIIWFMPIHPVGIEGKKGPLGCPYANKDYRTVNPDYGTIDDFKELVDEIHQRNMKVMIDVVYNHTSPDSNLVKEHPEFFYYKNNKRGNKIGEWSDVVDLDYNNKELWTYQIDSLKYWASIVDGFRCDVASFVPLEFWKQARSEVSKINKDCIWLAESVHLGFGQHARMLGFYSMKDTEAFEAFDMEYEYDIREVFEQYLNDETNLSHYADMLNIQECLYPNNYNKLRYLENHDTKRFIQYVKDEKAYNNYTSFLYFNKGTTLIYAGQEFKNDFTPTLFDKQPIVYDTDNDQSKLLKSLYDMKQSILDSDDLYKVVADDKLDILTCYRKNKNSIKVGIFSLKGKNGTIDIELEDGIYTNVLTNTNIEVKDKQIVSDGNPIILKKAVD